MKKILFALPILLLISCGESRQEKLKRIENEHRQKLIVLKQYTKAREQNTMQYYLVMEAEEQRRFNALERPVTTQAFKDSVNARFDFRRDSIRHVFDSLLRMDSVRIFRRAR